MWFNHNLQERSGGGKSGHTAYSMEKPISPGLRGVERREIATWAADVSNIANMILLQCGLVQKQSLGYLISMLCSLKMCDKPWDFGGIPVSLIFRQTQSYPYLCVGRVSRAGSRIMLSVPVRGTQFYQWFPDIFFPMFWLTISLIIIFVGWTSIRFLNPYTFHCLHGSFLSCRDCLLSLSLCAFDCVSYFCWSFFMPLATYIPQS